MSSKGYKPLWLRYKAMADETPFKESIWFPLQDNLNSRAAEIERIDLGRHRPRKRYVPYVAVSLRWTNRERHKRSRRVWSALSPVADKPSSLRPCREKRRAADQARNRMDKAVGPCRGR